MRLSGELATLLCENSGTDVERLMDKFSLDLSLVARLGGHLPPCNQKGKERFPEAEIITKARVTELF